MSTIPTGLIVLSAPGVWSRLQHVSNNRLISGMSNATGRLEREGVPRDFEGIVEAFNDWWRGRVPVQVAFALWTLRDHQDSKGIIPRSGLHRIPELNLVARFI